MDKKQKRMLIIINIILILIDQISKIFILMFTDIDVNFSFDKVFSSSNIVYILTSIIVISALIGYISKDNQFIKMSSRVILNFAIGGAISNVIDRLWCAEVITIKLENAISFNLSYIYIYIAWIGMAVILTIHTSKRIKEKRRKNEKNNSK